MEFPDTHWSLIHRVHAGGDEGRLAAETFCRVYWAALHEYVRRRFPQSEADAEDVTQGFLLQFLEDEGLTAARRERGRLRSLLVRSLQNYVREETRRASTQRRRGNLAALRVDKDMRTVVEERLLANPGADPEEMLEARLTADVLAHARAEVRSSWAARGQEERFDALEAYLYEEPEDGTFARLAPTLGLAPESVGVVLFRMRKSFRRRVADLLDLPPEERGPGAR